MTKEKLTHTDPKGKANMVDVSQKPDQFRTAKATGQILLAPETLKMLQQNLMKKGDVLAIAEFAGITAAKKTADLIPLCHPLLLTQVKVETKLTKNGVEIFSTVSCKGQTGVEMEALTAVQVALLTVYDMCKAVDKRMIINNVKLLEKSKE